MIPFQAFNSPRATICEVCSFYLWNTKTEYQESHFRWHSSLIVSRSATPRLRVFREPSGGWRQLERVWIVMKIALVGVHAQPLRLRDKCANTSSSFPWACFSSFLIIPASRCLADRCSFIAYSVPSQHRLFASSPTDFLGMC